MQEHATRRNDNVATTFYSALGIDPASATDAWRGFLSLHDPAALPGRPGHPTPGDFANDTVRVD